MVSELKGVGRDESLRMDQLINKWEVGQVVQVWTHNDPDDYNWHHCDVLVVDEVPATPERVPSNGPVHRMRVPVLQQMVGNRSGHPWTPRVGDSVLIGFYQNDRPVIFGTLPMKSQVPVCRSSDNPAPLPNGAHEVWTEADYHNLYDYRLKLVQWLKIPRRTITDSEGRVWYTTFDHSKVTVAGKLRPVCFNYFDKTRDIMLVSECKKGKNVPDCKQCELNGDNTGEGPDYIKAECDSMSGDMAAMNFWVKMLSTDYCGQDDLARRFKLHWPCGSLLCADSMETGDNEGRIWLEAQKQHAGRSHIHYRAEKSGVGANLSLRSAPTTAAHIELFGINDPKKGRILIKNEDIGNFVDVKEIDEVEIDAARILLDGDVEITGSCTHGSCSCDGEYAKLDGAAGGQTLCGGTGVDEELALRGTSDASKGCVKVDADLECTGNAQLPAICGGDGAGEDIEIQSTSHATKGLIKLKYACKLDGADYPAYSLISQLSGALEWGIVSSAGDLLVRNVTGGVNIIHIYNSGGVSIGSSVTDPGADNLYVTGDVNCGSLTDHTPGYSGDALAELKNITNDAQGRISHKTLPAFARSNYTDPDTGEVTEGRNIGNMVSILTKAVQQLTEKLEAAEKKIAELEAKA